MMSTAIVLGVLFAVMFLAYTRATGGLFRPPVDDRPVTERYRDYLDRDKPSQTRSGRHAKAPPPEQGPWGS